MSDSESESKTFTVTTFCRSLKFDENNLFKYFCVHIACGYFRNRILCQLTDMRVQVLKCLMNVFFLFLKTQILISLSISCQLKVKKKDL